MFQFHGHHLPGRLCGREGTEQISTGQTDCALPECAEGRVARVVVSGGGGTSWDRQDRQGLPVPPAPPGREGNTCITQGNTGARNTGGFSQS